MIYGRALVIQLLDEYLRQNNTTNSGGTNPTWNLTLKKGTRWKNAVEVKLTEEFSRKHPVFPVSMVKPYFQTDEDKLPSRKKNPTLPGIVEVEHSPGPVKKILKARKIRLNSKPRDNTWSDLNPRQKTKTNGWKKRPYQMETFL
ncbi:hypothetical protein O181_020573 [Austropuccinia psidii MF-1]|uniref:Uncharacterized protein n=1 Tax=Austropuccinia psidii MF-1 TaxID=1389203 RepID=A0A9Q3CBP6_9BASI|nr:hypothetical protein [Austropuccinia psidii MF-1]